MNEKIITKKTGKARLIFSALFGGIGKGELLIILIGLILTFLQILFLIKINWWIALSTILITFVLTILLITTNGRTGQKNYIFLLKTLQFIFSKKNFIIEPIITEIKSFSKNNIFYNSRNAVVFKVKARDISLMDEEEQDIFINRYSTLLKVLDNDFDIVKIELPLNLDKNYDYIENLSKKEKNNKKLNQINGQLETISYLKNNLEQLKSEYFLIVYGDQLNQINNKILSITSKNDNSFKLDKPSENEIAYLLQKLTFPAIYELEDKYLVSEKPDYLKINNSFLSILSILEFPTFVNNQWLANISNLPFVTTIIKNQKISDSNAVEMIDKAIKKAEIMEARKASEVQENINYLEHYYKLLELVSVGNEKLKLSKFLFFIEGSSLNEMKRNRQNFMDQLYKNGMKLEELKYCQFEAYKSVFNFENKKTSYIKQEISTTALAAAYPFTPKNLDDEKGMILGTDNDGQPVIIDFTKQTIINGNSNTIIGGKSRRGKTFAATKIINNIHATRNAKTIIVDPEGEFKKLCNYYGGEILNISSNQKMNPLEIFSENVAEHLNLLKIWFELLFKDLKSSNLSKIMRFIQKAYEEKSIFINSDLSKIKVDYPIFSDVVKIINKECEIEEIKEIFWELTEGSLIEFNGKTSINLNNDFVLLDTSSLRGKEGTSYGNAKYFLLLQFLRKEVSKNKILNESLEKNERHLINLAIDEAHLMLNANNKPAQAFAAEMARQIGKYDGIFIIISQRLSDFVDKTENSDITAIFEQSAYHLIFQLIGNDLDAYQQLMGQENLTNFEYNLIKNQIMGQAFLTDRNYRNGITIEYNQQEEKILKFKKGLEYEENRY